MANFNVRAFRKAKGLFQEELAKVIGVAQSNLSRIENNGVDLTDAQIEALYEAYGKENVDPFKTDSSEMVSNKEIQPCKSDELAYQDLISIIKKQNEVISQQVDTQNKNINQLNNINERLLDLLEKVSLS